MMTKPISEFATGARIWQATTARVGTVKREIEGGHARVGVLWDGRDVIVEYPEDHLFEEPAGLQS